MKRFQLVKGSESSHCCFEFTVVDTAKPKMLHGQPWLEDGVPQYEAVCECFERAEAEMIVAALNGQ